VTLAASFDWINDYDGKLETGSLSVERMFHIAIVRISVTPVYRQAEKIIPGIVSGYFSNVSSARNKQILIFRGTTGNGIIVIIVIGEILIDQFPGYIREGGASFNFAFHLKHLGLPVRLITRVGEDANGQRLRQMFHRSGFDLSDIQIDSHHKTGIVNVALDDGGIPTFRIFSDVAYDYLQLDTVHRKLACKEPALIYYGSLIQRTNAGFKQVGQFLRRQCAGTKCFCDINLRAPHYSRATLVQSLTQADILKLNDQEIDEIRHLLDYPASPDTFVEYLISFFNIEMVAITRGAEGSTLITGKDTIDTPPISVVDVVDTVGAGDGYAAMLVFGMLLGLPLETIAATAADFAARICQLPGAVPADIGFYDTWKTRFGEYL
jgi:fructokinase